MNRRSFLALIAGALAVEPARLIQAVAPALPKPRQPETNLWLENYLAWETLIVEPGKETKERLFFPPLPTEFRVRTIGLHFSPLLTVADMKAMLDTLNLQVEADRREILDGPLYSVPCARAFILPTIAGNSSTRLNVLTAPEAGGIIRPEIIPRDEFSVQVAGPALQLSRPAQVQIILGGQVRVSS